MTTDDDRFQTVFHDAALLAAILLGVVGGLWLVEHCRELADGFWNFFLGELR